MTNLVKRERKASKKEASFSKIGDYFAPKVRDSQQEKKTNQTAAETFSQKTEERKSKPNSKMQTTSKTCRQTQDRDSDENRLQLYRSKSPPNESMSNSERSARASNDFDAAGQAASDSVENIIMQNEKEQEEEEESE